MKPTLIRSSKQVLVLLFLLVLRGADSEDDLSKYVLCIRSVIDPKVDSSCENTPAKLQFFYETKSHNAKKVAKRDENSSFESQNGIKTTNFTTNNV